MLLNAADEIVLGVFKRLDSFAILALRGPVAVERHGATKSVVGTLRVVDMAPLVECVLGLGEIGKGRSLQRLGLERAMEALVLALRLRMIRPAVADRDAGSISHTVSSVMSLRPPLPQGGPLSVRMRQGRP